MKARGLDFFPLASIGLEVRMSTCKVCNNKKTQFIFQNKAVCFHCDELLFDMEIELDEEVKTPENKGILHISKSSKDSTTVKK